MGVNVEGELLVRGGSRCLGYYKQEQKTRETIDSDGWLHTGIRLRTTNLSWLCVVLVDNNV